MQLDAVGAAALLEDDREALARGLGLGEVIPEVEEGELEPALMIEAVRLLEGLDARRLGADGRRQGRIGGACDPGSRHREKQGQKGAAEQAAAHAGFSDRHLPAV